MSCEKDEKEPLVGLSELCLVYQNGLFVEIDLDEMPVYLDGGDQGFNDALLSAARYPPYAREHGFQGLCVVSYEITEEGRIENITIEEDPGGGIGEATVSALVDVTSGVAFSPGILDGQPVRVKKELRLTYKLG